jgi:hypothetical protein
VASYSNLGVVELHKMGLLCFPEFNQYLVGFANPFYPQNYPQKIRMGFDALLQMLGEF